MSKIGTLVRTTEKIASDTGLDERFIPENSQGLVKKVYPLFAEIDFGLYGIWVISKKSILEGKIK